MNASDLEKHDQQHIEALTNALKRTLVSTEDIVIAARTVGNSTSDFRNSNYFQIWKDQVCVFYSELQRKYQLI